MFIVIVKTYKEIKFTTQSVQQQQVKTCIKTLRQAISNLKQDI